MILEIVANPGFAFYSVRNSDEVNNMCEANAYLIEDGQKEQLILESVDTVEPDEDGLRLVNIFGEQKFVKAQIHALSLVDHKILLKP